MKRLFVAIGGILLVFCFIIIKDVPLLGDEINHYKQIDNFVHGNLTIVPELSTLPGYHAILAAPAYILHIYSLDFFRFLNLTLSLVTIFLFIIVLETEMEKEQIEKTLQFITLPVLFFFFFLVYTGVLSLFFILLSYLFFLKKHNYLCAIAGAVSILIRQNNIVWMGFMMLLIYNEHRKIDLGLIKKVFLHLLAGFLFLVFVIVNKGFALGEKDAHPVSFHLGNIWFCLFLFFFIFIGHNISNLKEYRKMLSWKWLLIAMGILAIFLLTFIIDHPYNLYPYFIRNYLLQFFSSSLLAKILFFIPIMLSIFSLSVTKVRNSIFFYFSAFLFLGASWLIEERYYTVPFALFILLSDQKRVKESVAFNTIILCILAVLIFGYDLFL